jgi:hypothetical protein
MQLLDLNVSVYYDHPNKNELAKLSKFNVRKVKGAYFVEGHKGTRIYKAQGELSEGSVDWFIEHEGATVFVQDFENGLMVRLSKNVKVSFDEQKNLVSIEAHTCSIQTFPTLPYNT